MDECAGVDDEIVIVCGSFYFMKDVRIVLGLKDDRDGEDLNERAAFSRI